MDQTGNSAAPVDWPARFRAAADVAGFKVGEGAYGDLMRVSYWLEDVPAPVVADIGSALLGEATSR